MEKGITLGTKAIEDFAENNNFAMNDVSLRNVVGESFLVLNHNDKDLTVSFVLAGASGSEYLWECIYSDLK